MSRWETRLRFGLFIHYFSLKPLTLAFECGLHRFQMFILEEKRTKGDRKVCTNKSCHFSNGSFCSPWSCHQLFVLKSPKMRWRERGRIPDTTAATVPHGACWHQELFNCYVYFSSRKKKSFQWDEISLRVYIFPVSTIVLVAVTGRQFLA